MNMLTDCVVPDNLAEQKHLKPQISHVQDAVFYPKNDHHGSHPWGIYDLDGRINTQAALIQGLNSLGHGQEWVAPGLRNSIHMPEIELPRVLWRRFLSDLSG